MYCSVPPGFLRYSSGTTCAPRNVETISSRCSALSSRCKRKIFSSLARSRRSRSSPLTWSCRAPRTPATRHARASSTYQRWPRATFLTEFRIPPPLRASLRSWLQRFSFRILLHGLRHESSGCANRQIPAAPHDRRRRVFQHCRASGSDSISARVPTAAITHVADQYRAVPDDSKVREELAAGAERDHEA